MFWNIYRWKFLCWNIQRWDIYLYTGTPGLPKVAISPKTLDISVLKYLVMDMSVLKCLVLDISVLEYLVMDIFVLEYLTLKYFLFQGKSWPSNGCNIPHTVGHFWDVNHFLWVPPPLTINKQLQLKINKKNQAWINLHRMYPVRAILCLNW